MDFLESMDFGEVCFFCFQFSGGWCVVVSWMFLWLKHGVYDIFR